jgi:hypothetical protein
MKHMLLSFCLAAAAVSAPIEHTGSKLERDAATGTAIPSTFNCIPSTEIMVVPPEPHEVHAVVVDMPQRASLAYASPESWGCLPMSDPSYEQAPYEQTPTKPVLQVALN